MAVTVLGSEDEVETDSEVISIVDSSPNFNNTDQTEPWQTEPLAIIGTDDKTADRAQTAEDTTH